MAITKRFLDSVKSAAAANKVVYSTDIQAALKNGKITETALANDIAKLLNKNFGSVDSEVAYRFGQHLDKADKDIYGVYNDVVVYYDQGEDKIICLTRNEFTRYYYVDWTKENRDPFNARYGRARRSIGPQMPEGEEDVNAWREANREDIRVLREGQSREGRKMTRELIGENATNVYETARREYKVLPLDEFSGVYKNIALKLGKDKWKQIDEWAKELGIPSKKIYALIAYNYYVQHAPIDKSFEYVKKNLIDKRKLGMITSDAKEG